MIETDDSYSFDSVEEMQLYVQQNGPLKDGKSIFVGGNQIR